MQSSPSIERFIPNEWRDLTKDAKNLDEYLTLVYTRALAPDCFDFYKPVRQPLMPKGFLEDYEFYQETEASKKENQFKNLQKKYGGYLKAKDEAKAKNDSDRHFLKDMQEHFKKVGLLKYSEKCRLRLQDFEALGTA